MTRTSRPDRSEIARMTRRTVIAISGTAAFVSPLSGKAESASAPHCVGLLTAGAPVTADSPPGAAILHGLAQRGYVRDRDFTFISLGADLHDDRLPPLVDELVTRKADVLITFGYPAALAAKQGSLLPIVSYTAGDPVGTGLVESLSRPGGHVTGISDVSAEITPKRIDLLREMTPGLRHLAMLYNAADPGMTLRYRASEMGAEAMGIAVQPLGVHEPDDFDAAFSAMIKDRPDAILMVSDALTSLNRGRVFEFAAAHRLPAIYENDATVRAGGLMLYGPDANESLDRVAALTDRILKGAKPADLPFEKPTRFRFAINLKTAKALGLTVSPLLVAGADDVIE